MVNLRFFTSFRVELPNPTPKQAWVHRYRTSPLVWWNETDHAIQPDGVLTIF